MAFRKKAHAILAYKPDIVIIQECEQLDKLVFPAGTPTPKDSLWFGNNQHKGLGIFSYSKYRFRLLENHNPELKIIIPIEVTGGKYNFILFAIWAYNPDDPDGKYIEQIWKAIHHYSELLNKPAILIGDFNSNTIWDRKRRIGNHSDVVEHLENLDIHSAYHYFHKQIQGQEAHPTFYLYRHQDKPYHMDYCFVSGKIAKRIKSVEIGEYEKWKEWSDHVPVIVRL